MKPQAKKVSNVALSDEELWELLKLEACYSLHFKEERLDDSSIIFSISEDDDIQKDDLIRPRHTSDFADLKFPDFDFMKKFFNIKKQNYEKINRLYRSLGEFDYQAHKYPEVDHTDEFYCFFDQVGTTNEHYYIGQLSDPEHKIKQGYGIKIHYAGDIYQGFWVNNELTDYGRMVLVHDYWYEGEFKHGKRDGYGKYNIHNGSIYVGYYRKNKMVGEGERFLPDNSHEMIYSSKSNKAIIY